MGSHFEAAVERAIEMMRNNLGEQLTVDDMARAAMFSKFHFTRIFQRVTGVTPGRFLSALRLQRAKVLLLSTSMNVADISVQVGYNSIGTFSSRFTRSVGVSPTAYRRCGGVVHAMNPDVDEYHDRAEGVVAGTVSVQPPHRLDTVFLGLFRGRIPEGRPVRCVMEQGTGRFLLSKVPDGVWYLLCQGGASEPGSKDTVRFVGCYGPFEIRHGNVIDAQVQLKPVRTLDPPLLVDLPSARRSNGEGDGRWRPNRAGGLPLAA